MIGFGLSDSYSATSYIKIKVKVNKELSIEFGSSIGGPQGDSLSGKLFTLSLAEAL